MPIRPLTGDSRRTLPRLTLWVAAAVIAEERLRKGIADQEFIVYDQNIFHGKQRLLFL
jgi:hypothetical protein